MAEYIVLAEPEEDLVPEQCRGRLVPPTLFEFGREDDLVEENIILGYD